MTSEGINPGGGSDKYMSRGMRRKKRKSQWDLEPAGQD